MERLEQLRIPPEYRLEALTGNRESRHIIRISDQFRVSYVWRDGNARDVEIADYH